MVYASEVQPLREHWPRVTFTDGPVEEIELSEPLGSGGIFAPIYERRELFEQVRVDPENGAAEWPGDVDLDPEVLYGRYEPASGHRIARRTVHEPVTAGT
jgi:hypothetical protein